MNKLIFKKADEEDIDELVRTRITVLLAANKLAEDTDMSEIIRESYSYYRSALKDKTHIAYLVYDGDKAVGTGRSQLLPHNAHIS